MGKGEGFCVGLGEGIMEGALVGDTDGDEIGMAAGNGRVPIAIVNKLGAGVGFEPIGKATFSMGCTVGLNVVCIEVGDEEGFCVGFVVGDGVGD